MVQITHSDIGHKARLKNGKIAVIDYILNGEYPVHGWVSPFGIRDRMHSWSLDGRIKGQDHSYDIVEICEREIE